MHLKGEEVWFFSICIFLNLMSIPSVPKSPLDSWAPDRSKLFASEISTHAHFAGEAAGVRLANRIGTWLPLEVYIE